MIKIDVPKQFRQERLVKEYGSFDKSLLREMIERIKKRLGGLVTSQALDALESGDLIKVASLTLTYYDKAYDFGAEKRNPGSVFELELEKDDPAKRNNFV